MGTVIAKRSSAPARDLEDLHAAGFSESPHLYGVYERQAANSVCQVLSVVPGLGWFASARHPSAGLLWHTPAMMALPNAQAALAYAEVENWGM